MIAYRPRRILCLAVCSVAVAASSASAGQERNLEWMRQKCPQGAAVAWQFGGSGPTAESMIKLFEVATGQTRDVTVGCKPEFSPDGSKLAWISGATAKGRMRIGDTTIHIIATGADKNAGVHWVSDTGVVLKKSDGWYRVGLGGSSARIPLLDQFNPPDEETDLRLRSDGVWVYAGDQIWKTSDGRSGITGGTCSPSISPDGIRVTGLMSGHDECNLANIETGANDRLQRTLVDCGSKGFDNHRWSSNDQRFIVAQYECQNSIGVWEVATDDVFIAGAADADKETYGDFTQGSGAGNPWPSASVTPKILCDTDTLRFDYVIGTAAPSQPVIVYTESGTLSAVRVSTAPAWLHAVPAVASGATVSVVNAVDTAGLSVQTYSGAVTVATGNAGSVSYRVVLIVRDSPQGPPVAVTGPNGGETYTAGQTMAITWNGDATKLGSGVEISLSVDAGLTWIPLTGSTTVKPGDAQWGNFAWTIPATIDGASVASSECLVKVEDYNEGSGIVDVSDDFFTIVAASGVVRAPGPAHARTAASSMLAVDAQGRAVTGAGNRTGIRKCRGGWDRLSGRRFVVHRESARGRPANHESE